MKTYGKLMKEIDTAEDEICLVFLSAVQKLDPKCQAHTIHLTGRSLLINNTKFMIYIII